MIESATEDKLGGGGGGGEGGEEGFFENLTRITDQLGCTRTLMCSLVRIRARRASLCSLCVVCSWGWGKGLHGSCTHMPTQSLQGPTKSSSCTSGTHFSD